MTASNGGPNRRPSAFQAELWLTPMCFNWPRQVEGSELDELEHLVRAVGPILAPSISDHLENGHGGSSGRIYRADYLRLWGSPRLSGFCADTSVDDDERRLLCGEIRLRLASKYVLPSTSPAHRVDAESSGEEALVNGKRQFRYSVPEGRTSRGVSRLLVSGRAHAFHTIKGRTERVARSRRFHLVRLATAEAIHIADSADHRVWKLLRSEYFQVSFGTWLLGSGT